MAGITTLFPLTRSVGAAKPPPAGVSVQPLAQTSPQSWGETDRAALLKGEAKADPQDPKGPLPVASVGTKDKARIVVYGTSGIAANQFLNLQGNRDFFLNTVSWLAEEEDQIAIRPKDTKQTPVFLTAQQGRRVPPARGGVARAGPRGRSSPPWSGARRSSRGMRWQTTAALAVVLIALAGFYYVYEVRLAPEREKAEARKGRIFTADRGCGRGDGEARRGRAGSSAKGMAGRSWSPWPRADRATAEELATTFATAK